MVLEDEKKFLKVAEIADQLPNVKAIVCWAYDPTPQQRADLHCTVLTWAELMQRGEIGAQPQAESKKEDESKTETAPLNAAAVEAGSADLDELLKGRMAEQRPGHCCALIYTSGTTGQPKVGASGATAPPYLHPPKPAPQRQLSTKQP